MDNRLIELLKLEDYSVLPNLFKNFERKSSISDLREIFSTLDSNYQTVSNKIRELENTHKTIRTYTTNFLLQYLPGKKLNIEYRTTPGNDICPIYFKHHIQYSCNLEDSRWRENWPKSMGNGVFKDRYPNSQLFLLKEEIENRTTLPFLVRGVCSNEYSTFGISICMSLNPSFVQDSGKFYSSDIEILLNCIEE